MSKSRQLRPNLCFGYPLDAPRLPNCALHLGWGKGHVASHPSLSPALTPIKAASLLSASYCRDSIYDDFIATVHGGLGTSPESGCSAKLPFKATQDLSGLAPPGARWHLGPPGAASGSGERRKQTARCRQLRKPLGFRWIPQGLDQLETGPSEHALLLLLLAPRQPGPFRLTLPSHSTWDMHVLCSFC